MSQKTVCQDFLDRNNTIFHRKMCFDTVEQGGVGRQISLASQQPECTVSEAGTPLGKEHGMCSGHAAGSGCQGLDSAPFGRPVGLLSLQSKQVHPGHSTGDEMAL